MSSAVYLPPGVRKSCCFSSTPALGGMDTTEAFSGPFPTSAEPGPLFCGLPELGGTAWGLGGTGGLSGSSAGGCGPAGGGCTPAAGGGTLAAEGRAVVTGDGTLATGGVCAGVHGCILTCGTKTAGDLFC